MAKPLAEFMLSGFLVPPEFMRRIQKIISFTNPMYTYVFDAGSFYMYTIDRRKNGKLLGKGGKG